MMKYKSRYRQFAKEGIWVQIRMWRSGVGHFSKLWPYIRAGRVGRLFRAGS